MLISVLFLLLGAFTSAYAPVSPPCGGADLTGCGPIARPDPRCDTTDCSWGLVSHKYSCPDERICIMDCVGCDTDTPTCSVLMAQMSCDPEIKKTSTCSKTEGVGIMLFTHMCLDTSTQQQVEKTCHEHCCCEKHPSEGVGIPNAIHCGSQGVVNFGFGEGAEQDKRAYCPGYDIPSWNL